MSRLFARHEGRHCRHGSYTGWAAHASLIRSAPADDFTVCRTRPALIHPYERTPAR
ncbi:hypothetical protein ABT294_00820 [Nonomuraea sp. NPDC000554]|uniref:hypothetical protein n=1 Tax=Nonomuraea sp. NPDC000554 TaxID=3154259 RepID=UPI00331DA22D